MNTPLNLRDLLLILTTVGSLAVGQILFKLSAPAFASFSLRSLFTPLFVLAVFVYAIATVLWVIALSRVPLTVAYPLIALSYVFVPLLSVLFLGEALNSRTIVGATIIIVGVVVSLGIPSRLP